MKKNQTLLLLLVLNVATVFAYPKKHKALLQQEDRKWSIGIIGGPQYARAYNLNDTFVTASLNGMPQRVSQRERLFFAGYAGIKVQAYFKNYLMIDVGILYSHQGEIYKPGMNFSSYHYGSIEVSRNFSYLKVPVLIGCNLPLGAVNIKFGVGLHANFLMAYKVISKSDEVNDIPVYRGISIEQNGKITAYESVSSGNQPAVDPQSLSPIFQSIYKPWKYKRVTWGIDYSLALGIRLTEKWELNLEARGDYEFIDNENKKSKIQDIGSTVSYYAYPPYRHATHNLTASFGVGVSYLFLR